MAYKSTLDNDSVSSTTCWNYDAFLSFRGEDTRINFVADLYISLLGANIHAFMDDEELPKGKEISAELLKAIQQSRSSIVVFSKNYASSTWCLDELAEILNCKEAKGQLVLPVFYDVDPSDVRKQKGSVAEALAEHEKHIGNDVEKIEKWRKALTEAANLSGWDICSAGNGKKSIFIQRIVEEVVSRLNHTYFNVAVYPIGIDSRVQKVQSLLCITSEDIRMIGICGMGGIGKTTIAKAVYNKIFHLFEGSCFLADVRKVAQSLNGLLVLQKELLSKVLKKKCHEIGNVAEGVNLISKRLRARRVLIIIDDVDHLLQLNTLARSCEWFGSGSRIIITTRDEHLLDEINVHRKYKVNELAADESLELYSWHAFRKAFPTEEYMELSLGIIQYTRGLPLALEILGSYLFGRTAIEWESIIEKLQQIPYNQIQEKLKVSFDGLDDKEKETFLDIACFFIGEEKEYVIKILDSCGFYPRIAIGVLTSRFLLNVDEENKLRMHDLVRDMGREIIRQESSEEPRKRTRVWFHEDVCSTLVKHKGTAAIRGLSLVLPELKDRRFGTTSFVKMDNLQLLQINHIHLHGSYSFISKELRWLRWQHCPLTHLPYSFQLEKLVSLDMQFSNCKKIWQGKKVLADLKILDLSYSHFLTKTPDFSKTPLLEKLFLEGCRSLRKIHHSIGFLSRLVHLNLEDCNNLRHLPDSICRLKFLEYLNLTGCTKLTRLPENVGCMEGLKELLADGTAIKRLPYSIGFLKNLIIISLQGCNRKRLMKSLSLFPSWTSPTNSKIMRFLPTSILGLQLIREFVLPNCNLSDGDIPTEIGNLSSLEELDLTANKFCTLPSSISQLSKLDCLWLTDCRSLSSIPNLPPCLSYLHIYNCTSLKKLHLSNISKLQVIFLDGGSTIHGIQSPTSLDLVHPMGLLGCSNMATVFKERFFKVYPTISIFKERFFKVYPTISIFKERFFKEQMAFHTADYNLLVSEEPRRFNNQTRGRSICFNIPTDMINKFQGFVVWAVCRVKELTEVIDGPIAIISDKTNGVEDCLSLLYVGTRQTTREHLWRGQTIKDSLRIPFKGGETMEVFIKTNSMGAMKKFGFHLIFKSDFEGKVKEDRKVSHQSLEGEE